jgi:hypothetical protein
VRLSFRQIRDEAKFYTGENNQRSSAKARGQSAGTYQEDIQRQATHFQPRDDDLRLGISKLYLLSAEFSGKIYAR